MTVLPIKGFVGPAGSGKTHHLVKEAERVTKPLKWEPYQALLGLTFMHGARRRLYSRFSDLRKIGIPVQCSTIDSFCLDVIRRFRNYLGYDKPIEIDIEIKDCDYAECLRWNWVVSLDKMRSEMIRVLEKKAVRKSIAASYPLVIIDEFQDCDGFLLQIIKSLSQMSQLIVAADPFQRLEIEKDTCDGTICDAVEWLKKAGNIVPLDGCERTKEKQLLNTAEALRTGIPKPNCVTVKKCDGPGLASFAIAQAIGGWGWGKYSNTVIITPVTEAKSKFVAGALKSLQKELGKTEKFGPYPFSWEQTEDGQLENVCELLPDANKVPDLICREELLRFQCSGDRTVSEVCKAGYKVARLRGIDGLSKAELKDMARKRIHAKMAYCAGGRRDRIVLTVHGAKNQEFDYVFILWPLALKNDQLYQRKLLYNAVTRASKNAMILAENNKRASLSGGILRFIKKPDWLKS